MKILADEIRDIGGENIEILNIKELMRVNFGVNFSNPSDHRAVHAILEK